jgi:hypothetical protein
MGRHKGGPYGSSYPKPVQGRPLWPPGARQTTVIRTRRARTDGPLRPPAGATDAGNSCPTPA